MAKFFIPTSDVETITPEKAREYLRECGGNNRNISKAVVDSYALTMKEGKWLLNGEPIVFDIDNILRNGYHRLHACDKAGVPCQSFVVRGVQPEVFTTFDCGRHRTVWQLIGMQGIKHYNAVASSVQLSFRLKSGHAIGETVSATKRLGKTNSDMISYFNTDRDLFVECGKFAVDMRECPILDASVIGGTLHYLTRYGGYDFEYVKSFFKMVCSYDTCKINIINLLRKRLLKNKSSNIDKLSKNVLFAFVIKAWNGYVTGNGENMKILKFDTERDEYPKFILNTQITSNHGI